MPQAASARDAPTPGEQRAGDRVERVAGRIGDRALGERHRQVHAQSPGRGALDHRPQQHHARLALLRRLLRLRVVLVRRRALESARLRDPAHHHAGIGLERDARAVALAQPRQVDAGLQEPRRALVQHPADRRIDELHRRVRAGRDLRRPMRVLAADRALRAEAIEHARDRGAIHRRVVGDELRPRRLRARARAGPAELVDQFARESEGKVERADPGAGCREQGVEGGPVGDRLDPLDDDPIAVEPRVRRGDRLARRRRAGEVDAEEAHHRRAARRRRRRTRIPATARRADADARTAIHGAKLNLGRRAGAGPATTTRRRDAHASVDGRLRERAGPCRRMNARLCRPGSPAMTSHPQAVDSIAHGHGDLPVHGHRGKHDAVGAPSGRDARRAGAPRCDAARGHRSVRRMRRQDDG